MRTLYNLLQRKNQQGFVLALGYYVELDYGTAGMSPAVESATLDMVITIDINLLKQVCQTLPPRQFKLGVQLVYVNPKTGMAYSILGSDKRALERMTQFQILTVARFKKLHRKKGSFKWCSHMPSRSGKEITLKEFRMAIRKLSASRFKAS